MTIGVGLVGLGVHGGWASYAHLPALEATEGFEVRALAASSAESAEAAGEKYGVPAVFDDVAALAAQPDVDLVVVAVKVPRHRELVLPALAAGKPVLCEWPLANGVAEAEELVAAAEGTRSFVGLQGTAAPATRYLRHLVEDGYVGEIVSTSVVASSMPWGGAVTTGAAYLLDDRNGATLLSIVFGHLSDAVLSVLGDLRDVTATTATRYPSVLNVDTGEHVPATAADQVAVTGTLEGGAVASVHLRGANPHVTQLLWEIQGTEGDLLVSGPGATLSGPVTIRGARGRGEPVELPVPAELDAHADLAGTPAHAVAHAYDRIRADLETGSTTAPDFAHGLARHRLLDAVTRAAADGSRQRV